VRWRFEDRRAQHGVERLEQRIAPAPKERVHLLAEGSESFPAWCVHVQNDGLSSFLLSTLLSPIPYCWLQCKLRACMNTQHDRIRFLVVDIVGDSNEMNRQQGIDELVSYGPTVVVPTLIEVLLDRGRTVRFWDDVIEGVCRFPWDADPEYVQPCAPALVYLLAITGNVTSPDPTFLLDALDLKVETREITYAIPVLLELLTLRRGYSPTGSRFSAPANAGTPRRRCPRQSMFLAAFRSRSRMRPQCVQTCVRTDKLL
jgi:hypothetical protein